MLSGSGADRRGTRLILAGFAVIFALYLASAFQFFEHVEDALISYTYARNAADGYGFVPNIGGERVEGFSNPLWVFLLIGGRLLGVSPFVTSRVLGIALALGELALAYRVYRDHLADRSRESRFAPLLAPALLASMPGFQMWNHMGLENPLYGFLLLSAAHLHLHELRDERRRPWSALALAGLVLTRPEAPLYVACFFGHKVLHLVRTRRDPPGRTGARLRRVVLWGAIVLAPFASYFAWRLHYFGWPLATPYYVKLADRRTFHFMELVRGQDRGERYFAEGVWTLWLVPAFVLAALGVYLRRASRGASWLLSALSAGACAFAIYSGGDWMQGWRWLHILTLPLAPLAAAGLLSSIDAAADRLAARGVTLFARVRVRRVAAGAVFCGVALWPAIDVAPDLSADLPVLGDDVHVRLDHAKHFADAFFVDEFSVMDGDQGALTYFGPPRVRPIDFVGLNDITTAHNSGSTFSRWFFHEYFFEHNKPTFYRARLTQHSIPKEYAEWARDYTVLPGYFLPLRKKPLHGGWMRKDVFRVDALPDELRDGAATAFGCGIVLRGARVLAPVVDAGAPVRVEAYWQAPRPVKGSFDYFVELTLLDAAGTVEQRVTRPVLHQAYVVGDWLPDEILRDPEALAPKAAGDHTVTLTLYRARHDASRDIRTEFGLFPVPVSVPERGLEACGPVGAEGPLIIAHVSVDPAAAQATAAELEATARSAPLADARAALARMGLVIGGDAPRVRALRDELSARVLREELAEGQRLLQQGDERKAADALLVARKEDVRNAAVNQLLAGISAHVQAAANARIAADDSRQETCAGFRALLDAVTIYPPNSRAKRQAETLRPECASVLSQLEFGQVGDDGAFRPDTGSHFFAPGQKLGLRARWRTTPNLDQDKLSLQVRVLADDGQVAYSRTVAVPSTHGEATIAWVFDTPGRWRFEARLEGRLETEVTAFVMPEDPGP
jgi:hypothetical protein